MNTCTRFYLISYKVYIAVGIFFIYSSLFSQNQRAADSLITIYESNPDADDRFELLQSIAQTESDPEKQVFYADKLIQESYKDSLFNYLFAGYLQRGYGYHDLGKYTLSLESFFKSLDYANKLNDNSRIGVINISIADVYSEMENSKNAEIYYDKGIDILREENDSISLATALLNAGDEAFNVENYDKALSYFDESGVIFRELDYLLGTAYNLGNIGMVYAAQDKNTLAEQNINQAIQILEEYEDFTAISEYLIYMSDIYSDKNDYLSAFDYAHTSLKIASENDLQKQISESNLKLSDLHKSYGNSDSALYYFENHIVYRDSVINLDNTKAIANMRYDSEMSIKEGELKLAAQKSRTQLIILGFTGAILLSLVYFFITIRKEKKKSDMLLLNILPEETAEELKKKGKVKAREYESVSVLFTDFKGFTSYSEHLSPEEIVKTIGYYFSKFDSIIAKHGLEKIKTIGDAYMCAGGIHSLKDNHAQQIVAAALEITQFVENTKKDAARGELNFDVRVGINSGPVVAGVVGTRKFAYDIWGDTVNVAARMESSGEVGKVNISEYTYALVKDHYDCDYRGEIPVKNRGDLKMYLVKGQKSEEKNPLKQNA